MFLNASEMRRVAEVLDELLHDDGGSDWSAGVVAQARESRALPVDSSKDGTTFISAEGAILVLWPGESEPAPVEDVVMRAGALVSASERYPALSALRPRRPGGARDCPDCEGLGVIQDLGRCWACAGLGYAPLEIWRDLRVGDRIRITEMPREFDKPGYTLHEDTRALYEHLVAERTVVDVVKVDAWGCPWIRYAPTSEEFHELLVNHDGIDRVGYEGLSDDDAADAPHIQEIADALDDLVTRGDGALELVDLPFGLSVRGNRDGLLALAASATRAAIEPGRTIDVVSLFEADERLLDFVRDDAVEDRTEDVDEGPSPVAWLTLALRVAVAALAAYGLYSIIA